jgi:glucose-1-phosphate cytidylyltransferase
MKVVIFAGGFGTRLMEETEARPKPLVEIGGKPLLWHILKMYEAHGFDEFVICLGYKAAYIKEYFYNYYLHNSDVTIELANNNVKVHYSDSESFKVTLIDTGLHTNTAGRLKRIKKYVEGESFMLTYGDGVADINLNELVEFHNSHGRLATVTAVHPASRFGRLELQGNRVVVFSEKPQSEDGWINGGFLVFEPEVINFLPDYDTPLEREPLMSLSKDQQLMAFKHNGFWQPMDTLRDKQNLEEMWQAGDAPWKVWS